MISTAVITVPSGAAVAPRPPSFAPMDAADEARLDAQILRDIAPYYGELERGFAATHLPRVGTALPSIGFSTLAKVAWAITEGDHVVGKAVCTVKRGGSWKIGPIAVLPEHRNRGHASAFLSSVVQRAYASGWPCVLATVPRANAAAQRTFARVGFSRVGALADHYQADCVEDVMACLARAPARCPLPDTRQIGHVPSSPLERIRRYVIDRFFPVDGAWRRWLAQGADPMLEDFARKPHDIVHGDGIGTALVIYKRGGTAKIVPVVDGDRSISTALVRACERAAYQRDRHKAAIFLPSDVRGPTGYLRELVAINYSLRGPIAVWSRRLD